MDDIANEIGRRFGKRMARKYSKDACEAAINGVQVPEFLGLQLHRLCTIRGIRYHRGFGEDLRDIHPAFARALNARALMSDSIPNLDDPALIPYCIWHPEVPSEDTCRRLVERYPNMAYHVARVCAVGGYTKLYKELDILPDVHVAEEARDSDSDEIFQDIVSRPVRFSVMNDYTQTIDWSDPQVAELDGNTAVRWTLEAKQKFSEPGFEHRELPGFEIHMFNITEDMSVGIEETRDQIFETNRWKCDIIGMLSEPLPRNLPTVDKDLLILVAAYSGDIDRYARLRRPQMIRNERDCCVRGIYRNTMFAMWWSKQEPQGHGTYGIGNAIEARFIMNNVLSRVKPAGEFFHEPYLIWYPTIARYSTYRKLAELRPSMIPQILIACIVADYDTLFDDLLEKAQPDQVQIHEAKKSTNPYYLRRLNERAEEAGLREVNDAGWKMRDFTEQAEPPRGSGEVCQYFQTLPPCGWDFSAQGLDTDGSYVELMACLPEEWRIPQGDKDIIRTLNYNEWPPEKL